MAKALNPGRILRLARKTTFQRNRQIVARAAELLDPERPMTLRHLHYLLISDRVIESSDKEYQNLIRISVAARMDQRLSFESIVDGLRESIKPSSWSGLADFAETVQHSYRKDFWQQQRDYLEFWFEKDAIVGVVEDIAHRYDVKMRPLRGQSSLSFLYQAAKELAQIEKPKFIYYLGDFDPSGYAIEESARDRLGNLLCRLKYELDDAEKRYGLPAYSLAGIQWTRLGFNENDFEIFDVTPLKAKSLDRSYTKFVERFGNDRAAELDAIPPDALRDRIERAILDHVDQKAWRKLQEIEAIERDSFNDAMKIFMKRAG